MNWPDEASRRYAERLAILHAVDRGMIREESPAAIAEAALRPLRDLLGVPRAIVNLFDLETGEVEWLAAIGRQRTHVGPGVRYPIALMGDLEALRRGEPQIIDTSSLPLSSHKDALLASGVRRYMAVPMIVGDRLIGALSFGGESNTFPPEQVEIAREVAAQLAIAVAQARLHEQVKRQAEELEIRVRERTAELEAANRELESFSYSVSHDLRAPLRAIDGFGRMLEEDYAAKLDAEGLRLLAVIRESSHRMGALIESLLEFSRLGRKTLDRSAVDMAALAREVWAELGASATAQLTIGALPSANGDPALLRQVWINLLSNALKYSARQPSPRIEVAGKRSGADLVYRVSDNGAGFDMRYYDKLFRVFQRLHRENEFPGTGVGLAIVQRIITRHGGRVWAEAEVGKGAKFFFTLPVPTPL